jgi:hypothetical protein
MRLRSAVQSQSMAAVARSVTANRKSSLARRSRAVVAACHCVHRRSSLEATLGKAGQCRPARVLAVNSSQCRTGGQCQFVVGASRRSAAPGGQAVGAAGYGSSAFSSCREARTIGNRRSTVYRLQSSGAGQRARPNPSIERTSPGKPGLASHVKR